MIEIDNKYIGIPFEQLNCWQFICHYFKHEFNIKLPCFTGEYQDAYDNKNIAKIYTRELANKIWPRVKSPAYPDLVVFLIDGFKWHAGIVLDNVSMLHTQERCDSCIERYIGPRWKNRLYGFYRYQG